MAVSLIDSSTQSPKLVKLEAQEVLVNDFTMESLQIDVFMSYKGQISRVHRFIFAYNES
jgi:pantothenate kinase type III